MKDASPTEAAAQDVREILKSKLDSLDWAQSQLKWKIDRLSELQSAELGQEVSDIVAEVKLTIDDALDDIIDSRIALDYVLNN